MGVYKTLGKCLLKNFDGCEVNFKRNSGRQQICKKDHLDNCYQCGVTFNILKEARGGRKYSDLIRGIYCGGN